MKILICFLKKDQKKSKCELKMDVDNLHSLAQFTTVYHRDGGKRCLSVLNCVNWTEFNMHSLPQHSKNVPFSHLLTYIYHCHGATVTVVSTVTVVPQRRCQHHDGVTTVTVSPTTVTVSPPWRCHRHRFGCHSLPQHRKTNFCCAKLCKLNWVQYAQFTTT